MGGAWSVILPGMHDRKDDPGGQCGLGRDAEKLCLRMIAKMIHMGIVGWDETSKSFALLLN